MAIKIRLKRIGRRNRPFYRLVVMDTRTRRDGAAIEELGWYDPILKDKSKNYSLKEDRILHWLGEGAQTSEVTHRLLKRAGLALRWHLMRQGLDEKSIEKEMQKWVLTKEEALKKAQAKSEKKKTAEKEAAVKEEAETPAEEAVVEDTLETEAPAEPEAEPEVETPAEPEVKVEEEEAKPKVEETPAPEVENSDKTDNEAVSDNTQENDSEESETKGDKE